MNPSFSIIIPTADRPQQLGRTLASLAPTARTVRRLEILVVDSGAPAATAETVAQFAQLYPLTRYIDEPVPGRLSGRHRGALEARGDVLAFLDDDVEVSPGWFTALQTIFSDDEVQLAGGPSLPRYAVRPPDWLDGLVRRDRQSWRLPLFSLIDLGPRLRQVDPRTLRPHAVERVDLPLRLGNQVVQQPVQVALKLLQVVHDAPMRSAKRAVTRSAELTKERKCPSGRGRIAADQSS